MALDPQSGIGPQTGTRMRRIAMAVAALLCVAGIALALTWSSYGHRDAPLQDAQESNPQQNVLARQAATSQQVETATPQSASSTEDASPSALTDAELQMLVGSWEVFIGDPADPDCKRASPDSACEPNDTRELDFESQDGTQEFRSYLHHRPELAGCTWREGGSPPAIAVECSDPYEDTTFAVSNISSSSLTMSEDGDPAVTYKRFVNNQ